MPVYCRGKVGVQNLPEKISFQISVRAPASPVNTTMTSTLTVRCQWEDDTTWGLAAGPDMLRLRKLVGVPQSSGNDRDH